MTDPVGESSPTVPGLPSEPATVGTDLAKGGPSTDASPPAGTATHRDEDRRWWQFPRASRKPASGDEPSKADKPKRPLSREVPVLIIIALALALLIKSFVVQPFYIPSGSMEQTLKINDRVLVNKMIYHFRNVKRGEIVVFNIDGTGFEQYATPLSKPTNIVSRAFRNLENLFGLGPNNKDFIKRVIAIGGDTVACCDAQGRVTVNGKALDEPYVYRPGPDEPNRRFGPVTIAKGNLWVMGDHRNNSDDSRIGGQVPQSKVIGQAFLRVWPISSWRGFDVPKTFSQFTGPGTSVGIVLPLFWWRRRRFRLPVLGAEPGSPPDHSSTPSAA